MKPLTSFLDAPVFAGGGVLWNTDPILPTVPDATFGYEKKDAGAVVTPTAWPTFSVDFDFDADAFTAMITTANEQANAALKALMAETAHVQAKMAEYAAIDKAAWIESGYAASRPTARRAVPQQFSLDVIAARMDMLGTQHRKHRSRTNSTMKADASGLRCIQGELMLSLGYGRDEVLPGTWYGVAALLSPNDNVLRQALERGLNAAQRANDERQRWDFVNGHFRREMGLAA